MDDDNLIVMEDDTGTIEVPRDLAPTPPPAPAQPAPVPAPTPPVAAAPGEGTAPPTAAAPSDDDLDPEKESDPRVKGILGELREKRKEAKAGKELARVLRSRPDVLAALQSGQPLPAAVAPPPPAPAPPPKPAEPEAPPEHELRELARDLGLWTAEGTEDVQAALRVHRRTERIVERTADALIQKHVGPISGKLLTSEAQARRAEALTALQGYGVDQTLGAQVIDGLLETNPELLADPQAAASSVIFAIGLHEIQRRANGGGPAAVPTPAPGGGTPTPPARVVTERGARPTFVEPSSTRQTPATMTTLEQRLAKRAGIKPQDWVQQTDRITQHPDKNFFVMEDDE